MKTFTPSLTFANAVINYPGVWGTIDTGGGRLCAEEQIKPPNIAIASDAGFILMEHLGSPKGHYLCHAITLPHCRGRAALSLGKAAMARAFLFHDAVKLSAAVPLHLPAARFYCRSLGLKPEGRDLFMEYFGLEAGQWAR